MSEGDNQEEEILEIIDERPRGGGRAWAFAVVAVVGILAVAGIVWKIVSLPEKAVDATQETINKTLETAEKILRPKVEINEVIINTLGELHKQSKLVVMSETVDLVMERSSTKKFLWDKLSMGTTVVEMRVRENKVQYILPLEQVTRDSFHWDDSKGEIVIDIPRPVIDRDIVEVQSNPNLIDVRTERGWARLKSKSGKFLENQIRGDLRQELIRQGNNEIYLNEAHRKAEAVVRQLIEQLMQERGILNIPVHTRQLVN